MFAPTELRLLVIDFDNLKEGDSFDPETAYPTDGTANCAAALDTIEKALRLSQVSMANQKGRAD